MQELKTLLLEKIKELFNLEIDDINLEVPPKKELWDFAFGPFLLAKELKKSPIEISKELCKSIKNEKLIKDSSVAWPYLNIKLSNNIYNELFLDLYKYFEKKLNIWKWKTIIVDYIWTNVWKPLHIWHMCTPNIGQVICNVHEKLWYEVIWDSHIWDWGIIFWKLIYAYKTWWEEEKLKENAVDYMLELYVKVTKETEKDNSLEENIRQEFKLLSQWNKQSIELWQKITSFSIDSMEKELERLHVKPTYNIWESFYEWLWFPKMWNYPYLEFNMKDIVKELIEKWIATKNEDNSVWVIFADETKIPSCILQKRDGTHGYLASDLAAVKYRMQNWNPKKIIYSVDVRQQLHLKQVFEISKMAWWIWENTELFHAYNWFISWKEGAFSTRKWNIIKLKDLLDESIERAKKIILEKREDLSWDELEKLSEIIWIWAIKYWYLNKSRTTDVIFDWDEFMTFEWNSGPYIQYAYVRWLKILKKSWIDIEKLDFNDFNFELEDEINLIKELSNYKETLLKTSKEYFPHILANYSYNLTKTFSSFYNNVHILNEENEEKKVGRLFLVDLYLKTLKESFCLLWIEMPEEM